MEDKELVGVKEIARRANVSIGTVDRVLHNRTGVSKKTKHKILEIIKELDYEHPLFDVPAINAQAELHKLNKTGPIYFCGSYFKYGFHEDAFASAVKLCSHLLGKPVYDDEIIQPPV